MCLERKRRLYLDTIVAPLFYEHPVMALKVRARATPTRLLLTFFSESVRLKHDQASSLAASEAVRKKEVNKVSRANSFPLKFNLCVHRKILL